MKYSAYISFFIILQMIIGFGVVTTIVLDAILGVNAVIVFQLTSLLIISVYGLRLWLQDRRIISETTKVQHKTHAVNALGFGLVFAFIMAEIVAVILVG